MHGSRASGYAKQRSDWDFIVLTNSKIHQKQFRDLVEDQNIEFEVFQLPINKEDIIKKFGAKLKYAKVAYAQDEQAQKLINQAQVLYKIGIDDSEVTADRLLSKKLHLQSVINGMIDSVDNPAMFAKKLGSFYPRIITVWYHVTQRAYSDNLYISIPYIKKVDPEFSYLLEKVYSFTSTAQDKILAAQNILERLFLENE